MIALKGSSTSSRSFSVTGILFFGGFFRFFFFGTNSTFVTPLSSNAILSLDRFFFPMSGFCLKRNAPFRPPFQQVPWPEFQTKIRLSCSAVPIILHHPGAVCLPSTAIHCCRQGPATIPLIFHRLRSCAGTLTIHPAKADRATARFADR